MKRKKITSKSISFSDVKYCMFCLQIDPHGNTYFKCDSIFLEVIFPERRASVMLLMGYWFYVTTS